MIAPLNPENEKNRLAALKKYLALDISKEDFFDDLTFLASHIFNVPLAFVTFLDSNYLQLKCQYGYEGIKVPRDIAFCTHTVLLGDFFEIPDTLADQRFATNPYVTQDPYARFYAGVPITTQEGYHLGTFCVIDTQPRQLNAQEREALKRLAKQVMKQLEQLLAQQTNFELNQKLTEKVEFIENLTNSIPAVIGYWDKNLKCQFANTHYQTLLEIEPKSLIGKHYLEAFPQPFLDEAYPKLLNALKGERQTFEIAKEWPFVGMRYGLVNYVPDIDKNGQVKGIFTLAFDTTTIRKTETKLKLSEKALQSAHEGIFITDANHQLIYVNEGFTILSGYSENEAIGKKPNLIKSNQHDEHFFASINQKIKDQGFWHGEITNRHKNGNEYSALMTIDSIQDDEGKLTNYVASIIDITESNKTKTELALTASMLLRTCKIANVGGWEYDLDKKNCIWTNQIFEIFELDYQKSKDFPLSFTQYFEVEARGVFLHAKDTCIEHETPWDLELPLTSAKGNHKWVRVMGEMVKVNGVKVKLAGTCQDITEKKEQQLAASANEIKVRNALIREVHHHIKNNLQGVSGILFNAASKNSELSEAINEAISQLQSVAVIHGLQSSNIDMVIELSALINAIVQNLASIWQCEIHFIKTENWANCTLVKSEAVPVALILNELVTNAKKHSPEDSKVEVSISTQDNKNQLLEVKITIANKGQIDNQSSNADATQRHEGLNLIASLMPKNGAYLQFLTDSDQTKVALTLKPPIIAFE